jgi:hypothetical protein
LGLRFEGAGLRAGRPTENRILDARSSEKRKRENLVKMTDKTAKYRQEIQQVSKLSFVRSNIGRGLCPSSVDLEQALHPSLI